LKPGELRDRRLALRLSQAELSRVLGVTRNSLARWERGDLPIRHPELVALALDKLANEPSAPADAKATGNAGKMGRGCWTRTGSHGVAGPHCARAREYD